MSPFLTVPWTNCLGLFWIEENILYSLRRNWTLWGLFWYNVPPLPNPPPLFPFLTIPYPLPLWTPATQATNLTQFYTLSPCATHSLLVWHRSLHALNVANQGPFFADIINEDQFRMILYFIFVFFRRMDYYQMLLLERISSTLSKNYWFSNKTW